VRSSPECFFVKAITLFDLVKRVLLEGGLDVVQNVIHMVFVWPRKTESLSNQDYIASLMR
jgi:hypothetical protein